MNEETAAAPIAVLVSLPGFIMTVIVYVSTIASGLLLLILGRRLSRMNDNRVWRILCYVVGTVALLSGISYLYKFLDLMLSSGSITFK